jgi:hypothetical protein
LTLGSVPQGFAITVTASPDSSGIAQQPYAFSAIFHQFDLGTSGSTSQLVQAMAAFGDGSGAAISNTIPLGADTSQHLLLTTSQHA